MGTYFIGTNSHKNLCVNCLEGLTSLPSGLSISGGSSSVGGLSKGILDMKIGTFDSRAARAEGIATGAGIPGLAPDLVKSTSQLLQQQQAFFFCITPKVTGFSHIYFYFGSHRPLSLWIQFILRSHYNIEMLQSYRNCLVGYF